MFEDILRTDVGDDGVAFDVASLEVGPIREGQEYSGVRLLLRATIVSSVVRLQVDVGFGDAITPGPETVEFPGLLDFPRRSNVERMARASSSPSNRNIRDITTTSKKSFMRLTDEFAADKMKVSQWTGFVRKAAAAIEMEDLPSVIHEARGLLVEPLSAARAHGLWGFQWKPPGPWTAS